MSDLGSDEKVRLFERFGRRFSQNDTIFKEGDEGDTCFLVHEGRVRLVKRIRSADRSLTVLRPGDLFGEDALLAKSHRTASALALTDVMVLALDRATFGMMLAGSPQVATGFVEQLVRRLRDAEEQLENAMLTDHPSRVVNTLLRLASVTDTSSEGYSLALSPLELSSRVGLDVETVKRAVIQLRDGGYLKIVEERIIVPDIEPLRRIYQLLGVKEEVRG
ncbi:MAG: Crp/Fnr family transcriptional regulator [Sandaracinaceae bacterium]|jgi:CRP/FNR family cyclic AMP-dependent transcriptional regulator|nr:Crp/Fnr family transcriptional regulator [Sandaracinaceae bacterium]